MKAEYTEDLDAYWDEPLTPKEAAEYLKTTVPALATRRCKERGPAYIKDGKYVRYTRRDCHYFHQKHRRVPLDTLTGVS
jgi:hypothetical protein